MELLAVLLGDDLETLRSHVVNSHNSSRGGIPEGGVVDGSPAQVVRLLVGQIVSVAGIQDSVGEYRAGADTVDIPGCSLSVTVNIVQPCSGEIEKSVSQSQ